MDTVKPDVILNERIGTDLKTSDFAYDLPPELIAQHPTDRRDASRLMVIHRADGSVEHRHFYDITDYIAPEDVLVINDSKVIPARLYGHAEGREGGTAGASAPAPARAGYVGVPGQAG